MLTIEKRKESFEDFQLEIEKEIKESVYLRKVFAYAKDRNQPIQDNCTLYETKGSHEPSRVEIDGESPIEIKKGTKEWFHYLAIAKNLVVDDSFHATFVKRENQIITCRNYGVYEKDQTQRELKIRYELQEKKINNEKKKLLYVANFKMDVGQLISLINQIDFQQYDVTLMPLQMEREDHRLDVLRKEVRVLTHYGRNAYTKEEYIKFRYISKYLFYADDVNTVIESELSELLEKENQRIHGNTEFDALIVFGEFFPADYVLFSRIHTKKKIHIQNYEIEKMKRYWKEGKYTGIYTDFAVMQRIKIMTFFDEIVCISQGLLKKERANIAYEFYKSANYIDVIYDETRETSWAPIQKLQYEGKEYFAYEEKKTGLQERRLQLLPAVPAGKKAWILLLNDLSGNQFEKELRMFRDKKRSRNCDMLFVIDNFDILDATKEVLIETLRLKNQIEILRNIDFHPEYLEQFEYVTLK